MLIISRISTLFRFFQLPTIKALRIEKKGASDGTDICWWWKSSCLRERIIKELKPTVMSREGGLGDHLLCGTSPPQARQFVVWIDWECHHRMLGAS